MNSIKHTFLIGAFLLFCFDLPGQEIYRISGKVIDLDNKPVPGAAVRYSGGMRAIQNGVFSIEVKRFPDTVLFTAYGYETIKRVFNGPTDGISIVMTPLAHQIEEIQISTGYQTLKPNELNGSISLITADMIQSRSTGNILERIVGHSTSILQPIGKEESRMGINVRGLGTIQGSVDPLVVLDGFIYEGDITNINPPDVESISILKDAAASSIWGARAGNGVIVITTKKGKLNQPLTSNFDVQANIGAGPHLMPQGTIGAKEYIDLEKMLFEKGYFDARIRNTPHVPLTPVVEALLAERLGQISNAESEAILRSLGQNSLAHTARKVLYRPSLDQRLHGHISGGGNFNTYAVSLGYQHRTEQNHATVGRLHLRSQHQFKLGDRISWNLISQYVQSESVQGRSSINSLTYGGRFAEYYTLFEPDGSPTTYPGQYRSSFTDTLADGRLLDWNRYPAVEHQDNDTKSKLHELQFITSINYQVLTGLDVSASYQYQLQKTDETTLLDAASYDARHMVNTYSQYNRSTGIVNYLVPPGGIHKSSYAQVASQTYRGQLDYHKILNWHSIRVMVGAEARQSGTEGGTNATKYGYYSDPLSYTQIDVINRYPNIVLGNLTNIGASTSMIRTDYRFVSFYGNASYIFQGKYILTGSMRRDGSNIFGVSTNDKWKPLWSLGVGWNISDERFYHFDQFPSLRLTATFGYSGNVDLSRTALPVANYATESETRYRFARIVTVNNPDLRWESLSQLSLTLNGESRNKRFLFSLSYFDKTGTDLYGREPYDYTTWGRTAEIIRNVAAMNGKGVELEIRSKNLRAALGWSTDFYFNWNRNRTSKYYNDNRYSVNYLSKSNGKRINPIVGRPLYVITAYKWGGLDEYGDPLGYLNGELSKEYQKLASESLYDDGVLQYFGSALPTYYGSVVNHLDYKWFRLSFNVSYRLGYYNNASTISYPLLVSSGTAHDDYNKRWQAAGDENKTSVPRFNYPLNTHRENFYTSSGATVYQASHIRMDYINIAYRINTSQWRRPMRMLELNSGFDNVGVLWKQTKLNIDPDYPYMVRPTRFFKIALKASF